jgi:hypothetical protein
MRRHDAATRCTVHPPLQRDQHFATSRWDEPFWHAVRMLLDVLGGRRTATTEAEVLAALRRADTDASRGLLAFVESDDKLPTRLAEYLVYRAEQGKHLENEMLRTEDEAIANLAELGQLELQRYGTQSTDHHQSSKVLVATVEALTRIACQPHGMTFDPNPQSRAAVVGAEHIWVSPRRLDGALPGLLNPIAIWEIKEYWGVTGGGSKMSDAIYECQLVGMELRAFEDLHGIHVRHYVFLDGKAQWQARRSDLRRAIDLLCMGLINELIVGREVLTQWPRVVDELVALAP